MKASYKIALAASAAICILAVVLIKGEKQPEPSDTANDTTQASAVPEPRKTLRADSPGDGSVRSMVDTTPANASNQQTSTIASDARNRIRAAQGDAEADRQATQSTARTGTQSKPTSLTIGDNTTGPIALARTEAEPEKTGSKPGTTPETNTAEVSNSALSAIFDSPGPKDKALAGGIKAPPSTTTSTKPDTSSTTNTKTQATYTIRPGDTFSSIAKDVYGDEGRWVDIAQANSLVDPTRLKVGQVLRLPGEKPLLSFEESSPPGPGGIETYTIRAGDSLSTVAQKYYNDPTLWRIIYNFNRDKIGDNPNAIQAGMTVKVPPQLTGAQ